MHLHKTIQYMVFRHITITVFEELYFFVLDPFWNLEILTWLSFLSENLGGKIRRALSSVLITEYPHLFHDQIRGDQNWHIQYDLGFPATSGPAPIRISDLPG